MSRTISASTRFLRLGLGTALFRARLPSPPLVFFKPSLPCRLPLRHCSSSALDTVPAAEAPSSPQHPWPEWLSFVHNLKSKGYLKSPNNGDEACEVEYHLLKEACLSFARDRYDLFKSLSVKEIQTLVEGGCPSLIRKAVNSAKRLRVYVRLEEADVCGACNARNSCDRAYLLLKESESEARTVDIMRLLLSYALDSLIVPGGETPPPRELVHSSARKLLSELIHLSETPPDPTLPKPASRLLTQKKQPTNVNSDWICLKCNFSNFARNVHCLKCKAEKSERLGLKADGPRKLVGVNNVEIKKGDWNCPQCNFMNFARNIQCRNCNAEGPKRVGIADVEMKKGEWDWDCPRCNFLNFARNKNCLRCQETRPKRQLNPGEWECPSCDVVNFRRNEVCFKCNHDRPPKEVGNNYEEHLWKRPN